jgi:hypothetical protein
LEHIQISKYRDKAHQLESMMLYDIYLFLSIEKFLGKKNRTTPDSLSGQNKVSFPQAILLIETAKAEVPNCKHFVPDAARLSLGSPCSVHVASLQRVACGTNNKKCTRRELLKLLVLNALEPEPLRKPSDKK